MLEFIDYEVLRFVWWALIGVLLIGYAVTDGFDVGVASLLKIVARDNDERRILINSVAPHWDGNQVWLITAGGAIFAAWPTVYAVSFSGFYIALMLTLMALFFRPIGFEYRSKINSDRWRSNWDWALTAGSAIPAVVIGVAFGNLIQGVPFHFDENLWVHYTGSFFALLNPFALLAGVLSLVMLANHGATYLQMKTEGELKARSEKTSTILSLVAAILFLIGGIWLYFAGYGYTVTSTLDHNALSVPTAKTVETLTWFTKFSNAPVLYLFPLIGILGFLASSCLSKKGKGPWAFLSSSLGMAGVILTTGVTLFPFIMPSSSVSAHSLTLWDATASYYTLFNMTLVAIIFVPIVLAYTIWGYYVMRGRLSKKYIQENSHKLY